MCVCVPTYLLFVQVWMLFVAVSVHKSIVSFTAGVRFTESLSCWRHVLLFVTVMALSSPVGVTVGLLVTDLGGRGTGTTEVAVAGVQGLAAGTFIYVAFIEVLPSHLSAHSARTHDGRRLIKIAAVVLGFSCISLLEMATLNLTRQQ